MNIYSFASLSAFIACLFLACFVYSKRKKEVKNRIFAFASFSTAIWCLFPFLTRIFSAKILLGRVTYIPAVLAPSLFLHFILILVKCKNKKPYLVFSYIFSLVFLLSFPFPFFIKQINVSRPYSFVVPGVLYSLFILFSAVVFVYIIFALCRAYRRSAKFKKNHIRYILIAFIIGFAAWIMHFIPAYGGREIFPHSFLLVADTLIIIYAIVRYRLLGIYIAVRRTIVYGILVGFVIGIVALFIFAGQEFLAKTFFKHKWILSFLSVSIITFSFRPLQIVLQRFADRFFFHQHYKYQKALKKTEEELAKVGNLRALLIMTVKRISDTLTPDHIAIFIKEAQKNGFAIKISRGKRAIKTEEISNNDYLIRWLNKHKEVVIYEELKYRLESEDFRKRNDEKKKIEQVVKSMEELNANICVPSFYKYKLAGGLILGNRVSGDIYTQEDLDLLQSLANRSALIIDDLEVQKEKDSLTVDAIAALVKATEEKDTYTRGHSERVAQYAEEIAKELKNIVPFRSIFELREKVYYTALMHDVGKVGIPDSILHKPSKLTEEEYRIIKEHPRKSADIIKQIRNLDKEIIDGVLHHHERWDGRGYPDGLVGEDIPKIARILAVADAYDAMTTNRPYRQAFVVESAEQELKLNSGIRFDPQAVRVFLKNNAKNKKELENQAAE